MSRKSSKENQRCYVADRVDLIEKEYIQSKVCQDLLAEYEFEGKHYCLLHYPSLDKAEDFKEEFVNRLVAEDYNFRGVYFPIAVNFYGKTFEKHLDFISAIFTKNIRISSTTFRKPVDFIGAKFLEDVTFFEVIFSEYVSFHSSTFDGNSNASFSKIAFKNEADFSYAIFKGYITFEGEENKQLFVGENAFLNLQNVRIEKPEQILFHSVRLQPNWFVNVDCKKLVFTICSWKTINGKYVDAKSELKILRERGNKAPNRLLSKACWQLADNSEENKSFLTASLFRAIANESKRLEQYKGYMIWNLHWWYWLSSFYGESRKLSATILFMILFGFTLIYTQTAFQSCPNNQPLAMSITECKNEPENCKCKDGGLGIKEAITHSIATALFQNVEYRRPLTIWGELSVYLEKILAPLQAALLALAIRRKFMR